jgi:hypothetical protein
MVELLGGSSPLYLLRKAAGTVPSPRTAQRRDYQRHWSSMHLDFVMADLDAAVQRALAAGATPEHPAMDFTWGCLATFADSFERRLVPAAVHRPRLRRHRPMTRR